MNITATKIAMPARIAFDGMTALTSVNEAPANLRPVFVRIENRSSQ